MANLPKIGDRIPVSKFHVSPLNVRAEKPFGEAEEDKQLIAQLRYGKVVQPFKARPEGEGYGVYVGRRRFQAKKEVGTKHFVVGTDCLIEEVSDEEAREASLVENLETLRKGLDPITRARALNEIVSFSPRGLRGTARRLGMSLSTLTEWLTVLKLGPRMQQALAEGRLFFKDALMIVRLKVGEALQESLAEILETEGMEAFRRELSRVTAGKMKRHIPKGVYKIHRVVWDQRNRKEMGHYDIVLKAAEAKNMEPPEYIKDFVIRHIDEIAKEIPLGKPKRVA